MRNLLFAGSNGAAEESRSCDCVVIRFANDNSAQDDNFGYGAP